MNAQVGTVALASVILLTGCTRFHLDARKTAVPVTMSSTICGTPDLWCDSTETVGHFAFVESHWSLLWGLIDLSGSQHDLSDELSSRAAGAGADAITGFKLRLLKRHPWAMLSTLVPILPVSSRVEVSGDLVKLKNGAARSDITVTFQLESLPPPNPASDAPALTPEEAAIVQATSLQTLETELKRSFQDQVIAVNEPVPSSSGAEEVTVVAFPAVERRQDQVDVSVQTVLSRGGEKLQTRTYHATGRGTDLTRSSSDAFAAVWRRARYDLIKSVERAGDPTP